LQPRGSIKAPSDARADLLRRLGRTDEACAAYAHALELARNEPERRFLEQRIEEL
jgi:RNA polymerase sigma-70 factor (ECF subfamily)